MKSITIATRGSKLALWQAEHIRSLLEQRHGVTVSLLVLKTTGDIILDVPLSKIGGKGLFVKEIEEALLDGRADLAVHSMKDVPMKLPEGLVLGAIPRREDPSDMLLSANFPDLTALPQKARVGTSSLRRQAQLLALRPDLEIASLRGNVDTRLRKLEEGQFDAIVMAAAGMRRLGMTARFMRPLPLDTFFPAVGQGALGIEFARERADLHELLGFLNHPETAVCVAAERGFLAALDGGCQVPIAAHATLSQAKETESGRETSLPELTLHGLVADVSGERIIKKSSRVVLKSACDTGAAENLGHALGAEIKAAGGADILKELYEAASS